MVPVQHSRDCKVLKLTKSDVVPKHRMDDCNVVNAPLCGGKFEKVQCKAFEVRPSF